MRKFYNIKEEKVASVRRAMHIISNITGCPYNPKKDFIVISGYMELFMFDGEGYHIALIESHSCKEWLSGIGIEKTSSDKDGRVIKRSKNPNDIVDYLAYLAGFWYPDKAKEIDKALKDIHNYDNLNDLQTRINEVKNNLKHIWIPLLPPSDFEK